MFCLHLCWSALPLLPCSVSTSVVSHLPWTTTSVRFSTWPKYYSFQVIQYARTFGFNILKVQNLTTVFFGDWNGPWKIHMLLQERSICCYKKDACKHIFLSYKKWSRVFENNWMVDATTAYRLTFRYKQESVGLANTVSLPCKQSPTWVLSKLFLT